VPDLEAGYPYAPATKPEPMPDVVVTLIRTFVQQGPGDAFTVWQLQQQLVEAYEYQLSFTVENLDPSLAAEQLRAFRDQLIEAVLLQPTLKGRVPFRSPFASFDFDPAFVEYEDGTTGREMTMTLTIGDLAEEAE
jgi:hypothetical protein